MMTGGDFQFFPHRIIRLLKAHLSSRFMFNEAVCSVTTGVSGPPGHAGQNTFPQLLLAWQQSCTTDKSALLLFFFFPLQIMVIEYLILVLCLLLSLYLPHLVRLCHLILAGFRP